MSIQINYPAVSSLVDWNKKTLQQVVTKMHHFLAGVATSNPYLSNTNSHQVRHPPPIHQAVGSQENGFYWTAFMLGPEPFRIEFPGWWISIDWPVVYRETSHKIDLQVKIYGSSPQLGFPWTPASQVMTSTLAAAQWHASPGGLD